MTLSICSAYKFTTKKSLIWVSDMMLSVSPLKIGIAGEKTWHLLLNLQDKICQLFKKWDNGQLNLRNLAKF